MKSAFKFSLEPGTFFSSFSTGISAGPSIQTKPLGKLKRADFEAVIKQGLMFYEREVKEMKMHLLDEVLDFCSALDRVLS